MSRTAIPLILELWNAGYSGSHIAHTLGLPSRRQVERVVAQARDIGDPRAVLHLSAHAKKVTGHAAKAKWLLADDPSIRVVPLRPWRNRPAPGRKCAKGHLLEGDGLYVSPSGQRECRECKRLRGMRRNSAK